MKRFFIIVLGILVTSCNKDQDNDVPREPTQLLDIIVSSPVAFSYSGSNTQTFFETPSKAYVSGYFYFEDDLADDIIFGLDIEFLEGLENPIRFEGADWMSLAGFNRKGQLWFPVGLPENLEGTPTTTDEWIIKDFGVMLSPNTWYKMTIMCDFDALEFVSVRLQGNGLDKEISLDGYPLEYPNYAPFNKASLTAYTFALRGTEFAPTNAPGYMVYFDDIEMGIQTPEGTFETIFSNGFEQQRDVGEIPILDNPIPLETIPEDVWYLENENAKLRITEAYSRTGTYSLQCAADLSQ